MNHVFVVVLVLLSSMQAVSVLGKPVNDFVFATDQYRVQITLQSPIFLDDILSRFGARDSTGLVARLRPRIIEVNYKGASDEASDDASTKAGIPVISDIERIKKVIEIIEFVGGKVDEVLEKLPAPESLASNAGQKTGANATETKETTEAMLND